LNGFLILRTSTRALSVNKLRSVLTVLGIVIGVMAVITLLSIGKGSQVAVTANIESLGTNLLFIRPGAAVEAGVFGAQGSAATLTIDDAEAVVDPIRAPAVKAVAPEVQANAQVVAGRINTSTRISGVTMEYQSVRNFPLAEGAFISTADVENRSMVVVLGSRVTTTLFGQSNPVGSNIKINGKQYTIIGILLPKGSTGAGNNDDVILAPITTVQYHLSSQRTSSGERNVQTINVQVTGTGETDAAIQQITSILRDRHHISGNDDFTVTSQQDTIAALQQSTQIWVIFLGAIAGISLLVGGIGIMNIMLVSVTERTREIGIRKSVGAKRRDILFQFLLEAALLSLAGGGMGVLAGWGLSSLISGLSLGGQTIKTVMSLDTTILAVSVSALIGIIFGLYPAYRAALLNPIQALRYE
jgi:putative ABC transport system permease protein